MPGGKAGSPVSNLVKLALEIIDADLAAGNLHAVNSFFAELADDVWPERLLIGVLLATFSVPRDKLPARARVVSLLRARIERREGTAAAFEIVGRLE